MDLHLIKTLSGTLKPAFDEDYENLKKIPLNEVIKVKYSKPRNIKFHRKFFKLVDTVYQNQEVYNNSEHLRKHLTIAAGYYNITYTLDGEEYKEAQSISFASMSEIEFSEFYSKFIDVIHQYFGFDKDDLIQEIEQYFK